MIPPCVIYEDEHLLVIQKPAGVNTHSPAPLGQEGIYEWLKHQKREWGTLAIIHRLDKATSGVMVFAKTREANRSLSAQFEGRQVRKRYLLLTEASPNEREMVVKTAITRVGEKYLAGPTQVGAEVAETHFRQLEKEKGFQLWEAVPVTGKTHQIRVHAAFKKIPVLGDELYGGGKFARLCLHAAEIRLRHPASGQEVSFRAEREFFADPSLALRRRLISIPETDAFRVAHGASDRWAGFYVEKWADFLLAQSEQAPSPKEVKRLEGLAGEWKCRGIYHKSLLKHVRKAKKEEAVPQLIFGAEAPPFFTIRENGISYRVSFGQGYSVGLFLDQRDNRRRILSGMAAADFVFGDGLEGKEVLNTFAYTCGFSVCAAVAGARVTSVDLSKKYLEWGRENFLLNELDPAKHDFIYGDVFDWAMRLKRKGRIYDLILLDPPTFSQAKTSGVFQAARQYGKLVNAILPLLKPGGVLFASTNAHDLSGADFVDQLKMAIAQNQRSASRVQFYTQPLDFPVSKEEPAYLKTVWLKVE